jgi:tetratricopeptide repeat protein
MRTGANTELRAREAAGSVALALGVALLLIRFFSPSWIAFRAFARAPEMFSNGVLVRRGAYVAMQVVDPFVAIDSRVHKVVRWRLLIPMIGHYLGLSPGLVLGLAHAGCVVVLATLVRIGRARGFSWVECGLLAVVAGASSWFFVATGWLGYYDSWLVLGLLTVAWVRRRWLVWLACVLTPWVDERFVLALPLALLVRWLQEGGALSMRGLGSWLLRESPVPTVLVAGGVALRLSLAGSAGSQTPLEYWRSLDVGVPLWRYAFGAWEGLRAGSVLVVMAVLLLAASRRSVVAALLAVGAVATAGAGLASADDLSRATTMLLPVVPLGWALAREQPWWRRFHVPSLLAAGALLLPANHVVSTFTIPINQLSYEIQLLLDPPPPFSADAYLQEAEQVTNQGDIERGEQLANVALRLAPSARAHDVRGVILARRGRWREALADFDAAVVLDPNTPEIWTNRARAHAALGDAAGTREDADRLRALAPGSAAVAEAEALARSVDGGKAAGSPAGGAP